MEKTPKSHKKFNSNIFIIGNNLDKSLEHSEHFFRNFQINQ